MPSSPNRFAMALTRGWRAAAGVDRTSRATRCGAIPPIFCILLSSPCARRSGGGAGQHRHGLAPAQEAGSWATAGGVVIPAYRQEAGRRVWRPVARSPPSWPVMEPGGALPFTIPPGGAKPPLLGGGGASPTPPPAPGDGGALPMPPPALGDGGASPAPLPAAGEGGASPAPLPGAGGGGFLR
jgi:hypothetical protein